MPTRLVLTLLAGLACALPLSAAEMLGVVTRIDLEKKELALDGRGAARGKTLTLVVAEDTRVLFGKQAGAPTDLAAGKLVRVEYETRDSQQVAVVIHALGVKPKTASTPAVPADKGAIAGVLRRVALTDREVIVIGPGEKGKETETTVAVPESARITKGGKAVTLEALKEDDQVSIVAEKRDGRMTASAIQVGAVAVEKSNVVPRLRLAIKFADYLLQKMEK